MPVTYAYGRSPAPREQFVPVLKNFLAQNPGASLIDFEVWSRGVLDYSFMAVMAEEENEQLLEVTGQPEAVAAAITEGLGCGF